MCVNEKRMNTYYNVPRKAMDTLLRQTAYNLWSKGGREQGVAGGAGVIVGCEFSRWCVWRDGWWV